AVHGLRRPDVLQSVVRASARATGEGLWGRLGVLVPAPDAEPEQALPSVTAPRLTVLAGQGPSVRMKAWHDKDLRLNGWEPVGNPWRGPHGRTEKEGNATDQAQRRRRRRRNGESGDREEGQEDQGGHRQAP